MTNPLELFQRTLETYRKHGWQLREVLMRPETRAQLIAESGEPIFESSPVRDFPLDAMWFARPARGGFEAWELRLVSATPYALFEAFASGTPEKQREERKRALEGELCARCLAKGSGADEGGYPDQV